MADFGVVRTPGLLTGLCSRSSASRHAHGAHEHTVRLPAQRSATPRSVRSSWATVGHLLPSMLCRPALPRQTQQMRVHAQRNNLALGTHTRYSGGEVGQGRSPAASGFGAIWMDLSWRNPCLSLPWTMCPLPEEDLSSLASPICRMWVAAQDSTVPPQASPSLSTRKLRRIARSEYAEISGRRRNLHQRRCALGQPALRSRMLTEGGFAPCMLGCPLRDGVPCAANLTMGDNCNKVTKHAVAASSQLIGRPSCSQASFCSSLPCRSGSA